MAELLQVFQGLLTPALLHGDPAAPAGPAIGSLGGVLTAALPVHVDREGPAVKLQHSLLEDGSRGEEEEGPDGGEGSLHEGFGSWATQTSTALILPRPQLLQTSCKEEEKFECCAQRKPINSLMVHSPRKGSSLSSRVLKAVSRTQTLSFSSISFSGCFRPDQNSGTTQADRRICSVSSSQLPSSRPRP